MTGDLTAFEPPKKRKRRSSAASGADDDPRPVIRLRASRLDEAVDGLDAAFGAAGTGRVFQRGGELVHVTRRPARRHDGKTEEQEAIAAVAPAAFRAAACTVARFEKFDARADEFRPIDPPRPIIEAFMGAPRWAGIKPLHQIVGTPLLRRDGSLLSAPGYDETTGIYLTRPIPVTVPERPTPAQAARANDALTALFATFPYADTDDSPGLGLSVTMAALLTAILRPTLNLAPIFQITSPSPGTGKSTLANVIAAAATGERAVAVATGSKPEEFEKSLAAALLSGRPVISLDNMTLPLGGQLLAIVATEPTVTVRLLGLSKDAQLQGAPTILATANNGRIGGDLARRTLQIRLDAQVERPELRTFDGDPLADVLSRRAEVVSAALTIVRWHLTRRDPAPPLEMSFAGFSDWTARVRAPLVALGHRDPAEGVGLSRASDDGLERLRALIGLWREAFGDSAMTCREAIGRAFLVDGSTGRRVHPELAEAIAAVTGAGDDKPGHGRRLGKYLSKVERRIVQGSCFVQAGSDHRAVTWRLDRVAG